MLSGSADSDSRSAWHIQRVIVDLLNSATFHTHPMRRCRSVALTSPRAGVQAQPVAALPPRFHVQQHRWLTRQRQLQRQLRRTP